MEERNMELDDDGKIKLKKTGEDLLADPAPEDAGDDIVPKKDARGKFAG